MSHDVIARAYRGEPLLRVAVEWTDRLVYLCSAPLLEQVLEGLSQPVGFPVEDVYEANTKSYEIARQQWEKVGNVSPDFWGNLQPFKPEIISE